MIFAEKSGSHQPCHISHVLWRIIKSEIKALFVFSNLYDRLVKFIYKYELLFLVPCIVVIISWSNLFIIYYKHVCLFFSILYDQLIKCIYDLYLRMCVFFWCFFTTLYDQLIKLIYL